MAQIAKVTKFAILFLASLTYCCHALRATVFGASGGVGQLICNKLLKTASIDSVTAISRNADSLAAFELLDGCTFVQADALKIETLRPALSGADYVIISVGTTAFPTKKWDSGNDPQTACVTTVKTILQSIAESGDIPKKIVLLSSIGVEKTDQMPFKLLNSFGVLDAKRESEDLLLRYVPIKLRYLRGRKLQPPDGNYVINVLSNFGFIHF